MRRESKDIMAGPAGGARRGRKPASRPAQPGSPATDTARADAADAGALLEAAVHMTAPAARRRGVHLALRSCGSVRVAAEPVLLFGAIEGLIANALARSGRGDFVIASVCVRRGEAVVSVADGGPDLHGSDLARMLWPHACPPAGKTRRLDTAWLAGASRLTGTRLEARNRGGAGAVLSLHLPVAAG